MLIDGDRFRKARSLLGWSIVELAGHAGVSRSTIENIETGRRRVSRRLVLAARTALETAGVEFIAENGGGAGVRLRRPEVK